MAWVQRRGCAPVRPRPASSFPHPVVLVLARGRLFRRHPPLAQINVTLVPVDAEDHDGLGAADLDQFVHRADAPPRQLGQQDHPFRARVLEQGDVGPHLGNVVDLRARGVECWVGVLGAATNNSCPASPLANRPTMTMTTSSTSGYLASYMRQSPALACSAAIAGNAARCGAGGVASGAAPRAARSIAAKR